MNIYTSYFARIRNFPQGMVPVSIAAYTPSWYTGACYDKLAPPFEIVSAYKQGRLPWGDFREAYTEQVLNKLSADEVVSDLSKLTDQPAIALVCYEIPGDNCHRVIVSEWLSKEHGITVAEYDYKTGGALGVF